MPLLLEQSWKCGGEAFSEDVSLEKVPDMLDQPSNVVVFMTTETVKNKTRSRSAYFISRSDNSNVVSLPKLADPRIRYRLLMLPFPTSCKAHGHYKELRTICLECFSSIYIAPLKYNIHHPLVIHQPRLTCG